ncbi:MAG: Uma2 family endonuclease [Chloroflexota bacterium]|nr:Uma2 family endonuclease [Chloroflexota bacterium]
MPSVYHQWVVRQLVRSLFRAVDDAGVGVTLWSPIGLLMPGCGPAQPDVLVIRMADLGMTRDRRIFGVPALLTEVLSPSNPEQDLVVKRAAYAGR